MADTQIARVSEPPTFSQSSAPKPEDLDGQRRTQRAVAGDFDSFVRDHIVDRRAQYARSIAPEDKTAFNDLIDRLYAIYIYRTKGQAGLNALQQTWKGQESRFSNATADITSSSFDLRQEVVKLSENITRLLTSAVTGASAADKIRRLVDTAQGKIEVPEQPALPSITLDQTYRRSLKPGPIEKKTTVVLHDVCGTGMEGAIETLRGKGASYHFIIGLDGTIYQLQDSHAFVWHARKDSAGTIGISFMGGYISSNRQVRTTEAQKAAARSLIGLLREQDPNITKITGHKHLDPSRRDDPRYVDIGQFASDVGLRFVSG